MPEYDTEDHVLRHHNRALRIVNRKLRHTSRELRDETDAVYRALCDTETEAERAMRELWARGGFDCGPLDYDAIVAGCVNGLAES